MSLPRRALASPLRRQMSSARPPTRAPAAPSLGASKLGAPPRAAAASAHPPPPPQASTIRSVGATAAVLLGLGSAYITGALYPPDFAHLLSPRTAPAPHHRDSASGRLYTRQLESALHDLPIVKELAHRDGWYSTRPYTKLEPAKAQHSLTGGALRGPGMLAVPPIVFAKDDESEAVVVVHLGRSMCGHDGIVHGGMVGVVLDEATGRNALLNLPTNIGVTANLNINYRLPTRADQWVVIRTQLLEQKGRKVVVGAEMSNLEGEVLADAKAVYVEPKWASLLDGSGVRELLGTRGAVYHAPPALDHPPAGGPTAKSEVLA